MAVKIKVANYPGSLQSFYQTYLGEPCQPLGDGTYNIPLKDSKYSGMLRWTNNNSNEFNMVITIFGPEKARVNELIDTLDSRLNLNLKDAPEKVRKPFEIIDRIKYGSNP